MPVIGAIIAVTLGWFWWTGRIRTENILPISAALGGLFGLMRGITPMAVIGIAGAGFFIWQMTRNKRKSPEQLLAEAQAEAEKLLGLPPDYDTEMLDAAYRFAVKAAHPDAGGDADQLAALTDARELLRARLLRHPTG